MKYLNKRTGVVIDVPCRLDGPDWKEVTEAKADPEPAAAPAPAKKAAPKRKAKASD